MAKKAKRSASADEQHAGVTAADKIAGALALIAVKDLPTREAALKLDAIGFTAREIAGLLDVDANYVNLARFNKKKASAKPKKKGS